MNTLTAGEARDRFAEIVNQAAFGEKRVVITRHGKKVAALVPMADLDRLYELERLIDVDDAKKALKEAQAQGTVTLETLRRTLGK